MNVRSTQNKFWPMFHSSTIQDICTDNGAILLSCLCNNEVLEKNKLENVFNKIQIFKRIEQQNKTKNERNTSFHPNYLLLSTKTGFVTAQSPEKFSQRLNTDQRASFESAANLHNKFLVVKYYLFFSNHNNLRK